MTSQKNTRKYYLLYLMLFVFMCFTAFYPFIAEGKSFIWGAGVEDGLSQHFESLAYWGHYLRELVKNIASGHRRSLESSVYFCACEAYRDYV